MEDAAYAAGESAARFFKAGQRTLADVIYKEGGSPVTEADLLADQKIHDVLARAYPNIPIFSEERPPQLEKPSESLFVVDPIDGTRAFIEGRLEWCVSIAFLQDKIPRAGVIFVPASRKLFSARHGNGAWLNGERLLKKSPDMTAIRLNNVRGTAPLSEDRRIVYQDEPMLSLAHRLAAVATNDYDLAYARAGAKDWDIAAADVILREANVLLLTNQGKKPFYSAPYILEHPPLFAGDACVLEAAVDFSEKNQDLS